MRRTVLVLLCLGVLAAPAVAAPRAATLSDPKGDWPVAAEDLLAIRVKGVRSGATASVTAALDLAAPPDATTQYSVGLTTGCTSWVFSVRNVGTDLQTANLERVECGDPTNRAGSVTTGTDVRVTGSTVEFTAPYGLGLSRGMKVTSMSAGAGPVFTGAYVGNGVGDRGYVVSGDLAFGKVAYVMP